MQGQVFEALPKMKDCSEQGKDARPWNSFCALLTDKSSYNERHQEASSICVLGQLWQGTRRVRPKAPSNLKLSSLETCASKPDRSKTAFYSSDAHSLDGLGTQSLSGTPGTCSMAWHPHRVRVRIWHCGPSRSKPWCLLLSQGLLRGISFVSVVPKLPKLKTPKKENGLLTLLRNILNVIPKTESGMPFSVQP